jgi:phage shock protein A
MRTRAAQPLRGVLPSSIVIAARGGQAPGQGRRVEDTMTHDKIRAAARKRMEQTREPYAAARRAVVTGHQDGNGEISSPDAGCALRMSGEIRDWLAGLRDSNPVAAIVVGQALAALLNEGARLGAPLVVSTADSWPLALAAGLDRSYQEKLERLTVVRRGEADAAALSEDIRKQAADLESAQEKLRDQRRRLLNADRTQEAAQAARGLAAIQQQTAQVQKLLRKVIETRRRLGEEMQRLRTHAGAFRGRTEVLKASYTSAHLSLALHESMTAAGLAEDGDEAVSATEARLLRDATSQMERELGQTAWPDGLMELRPAGHDIGIRILFAVEPPGAVLLIAVVDGPEAVRDQYPEAILLSADMLRQVRAGQAPEAAARTYGNTQSFLAEFYPGGSGAESLARRDTPEKTRNL